MLEDSGQALPFPVLLTHLLSFLHPLDASATRMPVCAHGHSHCPRSATPTQCAPHPDALVPPSVCNARNSPKSTPALLLDQVLRVAKIAADGKEGFGHRAYRYQTEDGLHRPLPPSHTVQWHATLPPPPSPAKTVSLSQHFVLLFTAVDLFLASLAH